MTIEAGTIMLNTFLWKNGKLETDLSRAEMLAALMAKDSLLWVDLEAPTEFETDSLVEIFNFHPLAVEDCMSDHPHPKLDDYDEHLFLVMHAVMKGRDERLGNEELKTNELAVFFGKNYVVTFHRMPVTAVAVTRESVRKKPERWLAQGSDLLAHAILDALVDHYQPMLDEYDEKIDKLEQDIFNHPPSNYLSILMQLKQDIFYLKRIVAPQRDTISFLIKNPGAFIKNENLIYFKDVHDHLCRIQSVIEGFHENLSNILHVYFSYSSHKLNEVVKHLTVLATITMPAVIIASIYGMNFQYMPELDWKYGYPFSIGLSILISVALLLWMKLKKWI